MTLPTGTITMSDVNTELGYSYNAAITLNDTAVRTLVGKASGIISMYDLQGKSSFIQRWYFDYPTYTPYNYWKLVSNTNVNTIVFAAGSINYNPSTIYTDSNGRKYVEYGDYRYTRGGSYIQRVGTYDYYHSVYRGSTGQLAPAHAYENYPWRCDSYDYAYFDSDGMGWTSMYSGGNLVYNGEYGYLSDSVSRYYYESGGIRYTLGAAKYAGLYMYIYKGSVDTEAPTDRHW